MQFAGRALFALLALAMIPDQAFAGDLNSGDTAWMLTSTALVLLYDHSGSCAVLWRTRACQERSFCPDAVFCAHGSH